MRKYKKEEEQYFTEYDPSKYYGVLVVGVSTFNRNVLMNIYDGFLPFTLKPNRSRYGLPKSFKEACTTKFWQVFEFDTRKELLEWLLEEHK